LFFVYINKMDSVPNPTPEEICKDRQQYAKSKIIEQNYGSMDWHWEYNNHWLIYPKHHLYNTRCIDKFNKIKNNHKQVGTADHAIIDHCTREFPIKCPADDTKINFNEILLNYKKCLADR